MLAYDGAVLFPSSRRNVSYFYGALSFIFRFYFRVFFFITKCKYGYFLRIVCKCKSRSRRVRLDEQTNKLASELFNMGTNKFYAFEALLLLVILYMCFRLFASQRIGKGGETSRFETGQLLFHSISPCGLVQRELKPLKRF